MPTVIHRDFTFAYRGETYSLVDGGPGWGYEIVDADCHRIADGFFTLHEVRAYVEEHRRNGWPLMRETPRTRM